MDDLALFPILLAAAAASATIASSCLTALQVGTGRFVGSIVAWTLAAAAFAPWGVALVWEASERSLGLSDAQNLLNVNAAAASVCFVYQIAAPGQLETERPHGVARSLRIGAVVAAVLQLATFGLLYVAAMALMYAG